MRCQFYENDKQYRRQYQNRKVPLDAGSEDGAQKSTTDTTRAGYGIHKNSCRCEILIQIINHSFFFFFLFGLQSRISGPPNFPMFIQVAFIAIFLAEKVLSIGCSIQRLNGLKSGSLDKGLA